MELADEEKRFLINVLKQISINPTAPDAAESVAIVQSIFMKLSK